MKLTIILFWIIGFFIIGSSPIYMLYDDIYFGFMLCFLGTAISVASFFLREIRIKF